VQTTLAELASLVGGSILRGDPGQGLSGFAAIEESSAGDVTFFGNERYLNALKMSEAGAALVPAGFPGDAVANIPSLIEVDNPSSAFAAVVKRFGIQPAQFHAGVHPSAVIDPTAQLDPAQVSVGANVVVEAGAVIGAGTTVGAGCVVGEDVRIGSDCLLHPNVTVCRRCILGDRVILQSGCVIGSDGFGYEPDAQGMFHKIPQVGIVQLDDDVEIGANATIDRARFGRTWIRQGVKIDNLCQVAHNCVIGENSALAAQVGVAGSARLGRNVMAGGQAGINGHVRIGDRVVVMGQAGATKDIDRPGYYHGFPAIPRREALRREALVNRLGEFVKRLRALEQKIENLEGGGSP
jgi:UDP-3-O-[3-hydroxymyristoyl] glucosamine N-acyltransferase